MGAQLKQGASFSPRELEAIARALDRALAVAMADERVLGLMPARELKHRLACLIIAEAGQGSLSADRLADMAIGTLRTLAATKHP